MFGIPRSSADHVLVAGAGIAGLTAALALARAGSRVTVFEQAEKLEAVGAGIQLSPNATRVLISLGLGERLAPAIVKPDSVRVMDAPSGREIVRIPLNRTEERYGAPFWVLHRADLQSALIDAVAAMPNVTLRLGTEVGSWSIDVKGLCFLRTNGDQLVDERGIVLIGADGIDSKIAMAHSPNNYELRAPYCLAWRALVRGDAIPEEYRLPFVNLWLGQQAHLVHYPIKGGRLINFVAIIHDNWNERWGSPVGKRQDILRHFAQRSWADKARALIAIPELWQKSPVYKDGGFRYCTGPVTLIGDAAHPMLPFLAQGAGLAIEDAAVLAHYLRTYRDDPVRALRHYENARRMRAERTQRASAKQGDIYSMSGPAAFIRNLVMGAIGGKRLLNRYDWLYSWRPPEFIGA